VGETNSISKEMSLLYVISVQPISPTLP